LQIEDPGTEVHRRGRDAAQASAPPRYPTHLAGPESGPGTGLVDIAAQQPDDRLLRTNLTCAEPAAAHYRCSTRELPGLLAGLATSATKDRYRGRPATS